MSKGVLTGTLSELCKHRWQNILNVQLWRRERFESKQNHYYLNQLHKNESKKTPYDQDNKVWRNYNNREADCVYQHNCKFFDFGMFLNCHCLPLLIYHCFLNADRKAVSWGVTLEIFSELWQLPTTGMCRSVDTTHSSAGEILKKGNQDITWLRGKPLICRKLKLGDVWKITSEKQVKVFLLYFPHQVPEMASA